MDFPRINLTNYTCAVLPETHSLETESNSAILVFKVDSNLPGISQHFPGNQLIAAYVQLAWVQSLLLRWIPDARIARYLDVTFYGKITPPTNIQVVVSATQTRSRIKFEIYEDAVKRTKGNLEIESLTAT